MTAARLVPFRPVYAVGDRLVPDDSRVDPDLVGRLRQVFEFYGVAYEEADGGLVVPEEVAADLDTCWNYTSKADDAEWLRAHRP